MNLNLWKGFGNVVFWGVEHALAYNVLTSLQQQNIYALVTDNDQKQALIEKLKEQDFDAKLSIEQAYLNDKEGKETLREFSLPQFNSINSPSGIFDSYPGLKQLQMHSVQCLSPNSLLKRYELSKQVENALWLEVNGQITSTITAIIESKEIYLFAKLLVFMPDQAWYESEIDADKLILKLKQMGYDVFSEISDLDIDQKLYEFRRHPVVLEKIALGVELEHSLESFKTELKAIKAKEKDAVTKAETQKGEFEKQLQEEKNLVNAVNEVNAKEREELQTKVEKLQNESNQHKSSADTLKKEQEELRTKKVELEQSVEGFKTELEVIKAKEKDAVTKAETQKGEFEKQLQEEKNLVNAVNEVNAKEREELQTKVEKLQNESNQHKSSADTLKKEQEELRTKKVELEQSVEGFKTELEVIKAKEKDAVTKAETQKGEFEKQLQEEKNRIDIAIKLLETKNNYFIKPDYVSRTKYMHYNDQECEDEWQLEVYLHALGLMKKHNFKKIVDIGCGSGYKLMHYLDEYETIGLELEENLGFLNDKYPSRVWVESNFNIKPKIKTDVLICSDVIEHLVDPDELINYIKKISFKYLVLSTPERELVYEKDSKFLDGPPRNLAHTREWNFNEFAKYIGHYFEILDHRVTNAGQSTQTMICQIKRKKRKLI